MIAGLGIHLSFDHSRSLAHPLTYSLLVSKTNIYNWSVVYPCYLKNNYVTNYPIPGRPKKQMVKVAQLYLYKIRSKYTKCILFIIRRCFYFKLVIRSIVVSFLISFSRRYTSKLFVFCNNGYKLPYIMATECNNVKSCKIASKIILQKCFFLLPMSYFLQDISGHAISNRYGLLKYLSY